MGSPYHPGELAVQARAGVLTSAARLGGLIRPGIPAGAKALLDSQQFAIVGAADVRGHVWASLLAGEPGILRLVDPRTLHIATALADEDPLAETLLHAHEPPIDAGVLIIDLATRRRLRINGTVEPASDGGVVVHVQQAYWICPKYIQQRVIIGRTNSSAAPRPTEPRASSLTDTQRGSIARADTLFIASAHPTAGADVSHRGGSPGFVQLGRGGAGEDVLVFPDYSGNNMFNTFGNLAVNPAAGILFVDFEGGATLQLSGTAEVLWRPDEFELFPGAERAVRFRVAEVVELPRGSPLRWRLVERSPFNPAAPRDASRST